MKHLLSAILLLVLPVQSKDITVHVLPHSHWDREWYMPFEQHRLRLVDLLDAVLQQCETDDDFYFLCDGQTIMVEDYLAVRPENRERIGRAIRERRLSYGPQYILPDTYLADAESQVRNYLIAVREAEQWAPAASAEELALPPFFLSVGYFPDTFGNTAQTPQLLAELGFTYCFAGRGFIPEKTGSHFYWQSPDGSRVFTHQFPDWYCNGKDLIADAQDFHSRFNQARRFAAGDHYLLMNGCDHQPLQKNLRAVLDSINQRKTDGHCVISDPLTFLVAVQASRTDWPVFLGEARSKQKANGLGLEDVASTRLYLKQANYHAGLMLETYAEPLAALAHVYAAAPYPQAFLDHAWKLYLQNQVHDDICGCSIDAVHQDMMIRFRQVQDVCEPIIQRSLDALLAQLDLSGLSQNDRALFIFNPTPFDRSEIITAEVDFPDRMTIRQLSALAPDGSITPCRVLSTERAFSYDLPDDHFRIPYQVTRVRVQLPVRAPSLGYSVYRFTPTQTALTPDRPVRVTADGLENEYIKVTIQADGRYAVEDKTNDLRYPNLGDYELRSDVGDEYNFRALPAETPRIYPPCPALAQKVSDTGLEATLCFQKTIAWSERIDANKEKRIGENVLDLKTFLTLRSGQRRLDVRVELDNHLCDYRLRVSLPTSIITEVISSEGDFGVDTRPLQPGDGYRRHSYSLPQGVFSFFQDNRRTLMIINKGLTEIEPLLAKDGSAVAAVTLLRCVGELGDWGTFPTPEAQCKGRQRAEFALAPGGRETPYRAAYAYSRPLYCRGVGQQSGAWPLQGRFVNEWPETVIMTAVKKAEKRNGLIIRGFNVTGQPVSCTMEVKNAERIFRTNLLEQRQEELASRVLQIPAYKIFTLEPTLKKGAW